MEPKFSIRKEDNFVRSCVRAPTTPALLYELLGETARKAKQWGFKRYCSDFRKSERQMDVLKDYDIAYNIAGECGMVPGSKHALVVKKEEIGEFRFVENVFNNAGYILKAFTEEDEAIKWIRK